ncbi:TetR/AcrR family transcriptional regulator [Alkalibacter saccharofermentans]|jgi:AcrR family transcriptional regulator|uniref:Transcriptional regulator, TetR family n=1 Tax=Alkalibacter saccharofermentans DSM 14828 TaxID=1120975 RepID=A0A1M4XD74_9FIRM|nr:helix-turn-helix domain-containing protein [Alkalibacter saccharofermentans]SHE91487.1 transcriptional regulator, TetR family [Alkalibacter saccharofermentans DSM 14828]
MRYKKGFETKENIIRVAKKMFYEMGYTKSTVQKIADNANIPLGLIPYYFKTKDNIVLEINSKFFLVVYEFVNNRLNIKRNSYLKLYIVTSIYYDLILSDTRNRKFFYEVLRNKSNFRSLSFSVERIYKMIAKEFELDYDQKDIDCIMISEFGARRELLLNYCEGNLGVELEYLLKKLSSLTGRLFGINGEIIDDYHNQCMEFMKEHDYSYIKFLA